jgi:hypothetical protein
MKHFLISLLITSAFICGCETVKTYYVDRDNIPVEKEKEFHGGAAKIIGVFLNDGTFVDLTEKNADVVLNGKSNSIQYDLEDNKSGVIPLDSIASAKIDVVKGNSATPFLIIGGVVLITLIVLFIAQLPLGKQ